MTLFWDAKNRTEGLKVRDAMLRLDAIEKGGYFAAAAVFVDLLGDRLSAELANILYKGASLQEYRDARKRLSKDLAVVPRPLGTPADVVAYLPGLIADDLLDAAIAAETGKNREAINSADAMANLVYLFAMQKTIESASSQRFIGMPQLRAEVVQSAFERVVRAIQARALKQAKIQQRQQFSAQQARFADSIDPRSVALGALAGAAGVWLFTSARGSRA